MTEASETKLSKEQQNQEDEYVFPYHHVPRIDAKGFTQSYFWSWGVPYLGGMKFITDRLSDIPFTSLIDIGCGDGRLIKELCEHFSGRRLVGVDYSARAIEFARAFCPAAEFRQTDILSETPEETFDIVTIIEVYEHLPPDMCASFLQAAAARLKDGGTMILTVPHKNAPLPEKHYRHFDTATLAAELGAFFESVDIVPFDRRPLFLRLLDKVCNRVDVHVGNRSLQNLRWKYYLDHCLHDVKEEECKRIAAFCSKKRNAP